MATILIVDDDAEVVDLFRIFLSREGHVVMTADGGSSCLRKIQDTAPDLIILDVMMAPIDGWDTLAAIRNCPATRTTPVIMITAKELETEERKRYGALFTMYLVKPVRRDELCTAVEKILDRNATQPVAF